MIERSAVLTHSSVLQMQPESGINPVCENSTDRALFLLVFASLSLCQAAWGAFVYVHAIGHGSNSLICANLFRHLMTPTTSAAKTQAKRKAPSPAIIYPKLNWQCGGVFLLRNLSCIHFSRLDRFAQNLIPSALGLVCCIFVTHI